ncbi:DUF937 domain-containing protein [Chryseobacterium indoltheticum]|uniref:Bacterial protein of uncharacterized function (DUF937) n=1 Tax=Chryseobacterium indoltheticum TaxID=254 RepID=A0A381JT77_9FLAO|nr:DUF937 domain-containing protein [Chryseobacterium indoltheticum]AZA75676.1 DUF937 domain-containing protein [Chryseobacterium indoltheticum]QQQ27564.1 DUF937 domain-containing protein [Chryseobacterium indoltheticum]SIQ47217.1 hypothetical protein SAMN05421682_105138 [Chryseobacterium indoltheticum]SUX47773.1 Bacterial protein of uncharacterised function (DUF937) [Chryseobacterium indoltheticum]SUY53809.1 Bacterial protein of uncharacterised function (DUF937) [Chryseobacterium indoltheticu
MSLIDLLTGNTGNQVAEKAETKFGISKNQIIALLAVATPLVISYLRNKSQDNKEAEALNSALEKDHDGSILDDTSQLEARQNEGGSILSHIFGNEKSTVENQLSQNTGISIDKIGPILAMLAPVIMGYIGKEKQQNNVGAGGLGDLLGGILGGAQTQAQQQQSNPLNDILGSVLGGGQSQSSGNPLNDILGSVLGGSGQQKQQQSGGLGDILGGLFGGK